MKLDQEIEVLSKCYDLLSGLDDDVKVRALQWLSSKFHLGQTTLTLASEITTSPVNGAAAPGAPGAQPTVAESAKKGIDAFSSFEALFKHVKPSSDSEKALVAAVYLQLKRDLGELTSAQVQKELKRINNRVSNITQAISALVKKNMMLQLGKEGTSQQARKKYKVTREGVKTVLDALN